MPARSPLAELPAEAQAEIDALIERHRFRGYAGLAEAVAAMGHCGISQSALQRRGRRLREMQERVERSTRLAERIAAAADGAGPDRMSDALVALGQERLFNLLGALEAEDIDDPQTLASLVRAVAQAADLMERARARRAKREAPAARKPRGGLAQATVAKLRKAIEG